MIAAPDRLGAEQAAEQQHFGGQEAPHAEVSGFNLRLQRIPVVGQVMRMFVAPTMPGLELLVALSVGGINVAVCGHLRHRSMPSTRLTVGWGMAAAACALGSLAQHDVA